MTENLNPPIVVNFANDGDLFIGIEKDCKYIEGGRRMCTVLPIDIEKVEETLNIFKKSENLKRYSRQASIIVEPGCRITYPPGELSRYRTVIFYLTPDLKTLEIVSRNIKGFNLVRTLQKEAMQYRKYYSEAQTTIRRVEEALRPLEKTEVSLYNKLLDIIEGLKSTIPNKEEKTEKI